MITRREAIRAAALTVAAAATGVSFASSLSAADGTPAAPTIPPPAAPPTGPFVLPPLPYPADSLEPHIDSRTMLLHHDKHHAAYVNNANKAIAGHADLVKYTPEDLMKDPNLVPDSIRTVLMNNVGGHYNHTLFWQMMKKGGSPLSGALAQAINSSFGSFDAFQKQFNEAATKVFGSGWAWLSVTKDKKLVIESTPNQENPITHGNVPLLGLDVWEHAYYLKYQNVRADYITAFATVVNWDFVASRYHLATTA